MLFRRGFKALIPCFTRTFMMKTPTSTTSVKPLMAATPARFMSAAADYIKELKSPEEWEKKVSKAIQDKPTILDFYAKWCGPCRTLDPVIKKHVEEAAGKINLVKVNIDECGDIAREFGVKAIPHIALLHKGKVVDYFVGVANDEMILKLFNQAKKLAGAQ